MPDLKEEIHVDESQAPINADAVRADLMARQERELRQIEEIALFTGWLSEQSETIQALAREYAQIGIKRRFEHARINVTVSFKDGRTVWTCHALNGLHQSTTSAEHAVFLLVDSHRTRVEDTEEFRARVQAANAGMTKREAIRRCARLTNEMRAADPKATGQQRDRLATLWLESLEAEAAKPPRKVTDR